MSRPNITIERLKHLFSYDPVTGVFTRIRANNSSCKAGVGKPVGTPDGRGYLQIRIDRKVYRAHRLAWFYMHDVWPSSHIDHINGARSDNRIANLRDVDRKTNMQNIRKPTRANKCGMLGVMRDGTRFVAQLRINGRSTHLGSFGSLEEASSAYQTAKRTHHGGCTI